MCPQRFLKPPCPEWAGRLTHPPLSPARLGAQPRTPRLIKVHQPHQPQIFAVKIRRPPCPVRLRALLWKVAHLWNSKVGLRAFRECALFVGDQKFRDGLLKRISSSPPPFRHLKFVNPAVKHNPAHSNDRTCRQSNSWPVPWPGELGWLGNSRQTFSRSPFARPTATR